MVFSLNGSDIVIVELPVQAVEYSLAQDTISVSHSILYLCLSVAEVAGAVPSINVTVGTNVKYLVLPIGVLIIILVAGIDHVNHAHADNVALKRPMFSTKSVPAGAVENAAYFSFVLVPLNSEYNLQWDILENHNCMFADDVLYVKYTK